MSYEEEEKRRRIADVDIEPEPQDQGKREPTPHPDPDARGAREHAAWKHAYRLDPMPPGLCTTDAKEE